jgi:hypothetical protein
LDEATKTARYCTGGGVPTVIERADEVVVAPSSSAATAVNEYVPAATLLQVTLYGLVVSVAINVVPR